MVDLSFQAEREEPVALSGSPEIADKAGLLTGDSSPHSIAFSGPIFGLWPGEMGTETGGAEESIEIDPERRVSLLSTVDSARRIAHTKDVGRAMSSTTGTVCVVFEGAGSGGEPDGTDESDISASIGSVCRRKRSAPVRWSSRHCRQHAGRLSCASDRPRRRVMSLNGRAATNAGRLLPVPPTAF